MCVCVCMLARVFLYFGRTTSALFDWSMCVHECVSVRGRVCVSMRGRVEYVWLCVKVLTPVTVLMIMTLVGVLMTLVGWGANNDPGWLGC